MIQNKNSDSSLQEQIVTSKTSVSCDGGVSGHPLVYLDLKKTGQNVCPYCSRIFVYKS